MWNWIKNLFKKPSLPAVEPIIVPPSLPLPEIPTQEDLDNFGIRPGSHGIDISHHNENVDFSKVVQGFIFLKATDGDTYTDPVFTKRWKEIKGRARGAYHFYRISDDPKLQAEHFCKTVSPLDHADLPMVLDIEMVEKNKYKPQSEAEIKAKVPDLKIFLEQVERFSGRIPIIYINSSLAGYLKLDESFAKYPLWLANYNPGKPSCPKPWVEWTFWQFSESEKVEGIGSADVNWFKS